MYSISGRMDADHKTERRVRVVTTIALLASASYVTWGVVGLPTSPWLAYPFFALEGMGLLQLALLATQAWRFPQPQSVSNDGRAAVDIIVTCTFHTAEELEQTLIGCRTVRSVRQTIVVIRPHREDLEDVARRFGIEPLHSQGNHVDAFWAAVNANRSPFASWLEAGQIPMPDFVSSMVAGFGEADTAVIQAGVGLVNKDSFAHLRNGRDENAFRHQVVFPTQGSRGVAPWLGGGSIVRTAAVASVGGFESNDQASLSRALIRLHADGWKSRYHAGRPVVRGAAPDSLGAYLMLRRRSAIESLRVFRTPENPLTSRGLRLSQRTAHLAHAAGFLNSLRQLALAIVLIVVLVSGTMPFGSSATTWAAFWAPSFALGVLSRRLLARDTMRIGDWSRQGWRALTADLSAVLAILGFRPRRVAFYESAGSGARAIGHLRLVTMLLLTLDAAVVGRGMTLIWPRMLPRFTDSGRILTLAIGLVVVATMIDVLQVAVRRKQRRQQFRLTTRLRARAGQRELTVIDLASGGVGAHLSKDLTPPAVGSQHQIAVELPMGGDAQVVVVDGVVRSVVHLGSHYRLGIEFVGLSITNRETLIEYCAIHHHADGETPVQSLTPSGFDVARSHPKVTQLASTAAVLTGIATLFFGPGAPPAFADAASPARVCLISSTGEPLEGGAVSFTYDDAWNEMGNTGVDGCLEGLMPERSTRVAIVHQGIRNQLRQDLALDPNVQFTTAALTVEVTTSTGDPVPGAVVEHRAGVWRSIGLTDETGSASIELLPKAKSRLAVTHEGIRVVRVHEMNNGPLETFSTQPVTVQLSSSVGELLADGVVEYYAGQWRPIGTTDSSGTVTTELLPSSRRFSIKRDGLRNVVKQDTSENPVVEFETVEVSARLVDAEGAPVEGATARYRAGEWRPLGVTNENGVAAAELLGQHMRFSIEHQGIRSVVEQDAATSPVVDFALAPIEVHTATSLGEPLADALVEYDNDGWTELGRTNAVGTLQRSLLPGSTKFRVTHAHTQSVARHDTSVDSHVRFTTTQVVVRVRDAAGEPIIGVPAEYKASGWHDLGVTDDSGETTAEIFPKKRTFRVTVDDVSSRLRQDVSQNAMVEFGTVVRTVDVRSWTGEPISDAGVEYLARGWTSLGATDENGAAAVDTLSQRVSFAVTLDGVRVGRRLHKDETTASFRTVPIVADDGVDVVSIKGRSWLPFSSGMEVLTGALFVRLADGSRERVTLTEGMVNYIPSGAVGPLPSTETGPTAEAPLAEQPVEAEDEAGPELLDTDTPDGTEDEGSTEPEENVDQPQSEGTSLEAGDDPGVATTSTTTTTTSTTTTSTTATTAPTPSPTAAISDPTTSVLAPTSTISVTTTTQEPAPAGEGETSTTIETSTTSPSTSTSAASTTTTSSSITSLTTEVAQSTIAPEAVSSSTAISETPGSIVNHEPGLHLESEALTSSIGWSTPDVVATEVLDVTLLRADVKSSTVDGSTVQYDFQIVNEAAVSLGVGTVVEFTIPSATELQTTIQDGWSCATVGPQWRCTTDRAVVPGERSTIRLSAAVAPVDFLEIDERSRVLDFVVLALTAVSLLMAIGGGQRLVALRAERRRGQG